MMIYESITYNFHGYYVYLLMFIERNAKNKLFDLLDYFPAVGILGPRQVGKTTLAGSIGTFKNKKTSYLDLESPDDIKKISDALLLFYELENELVILDEIQNQPQLFPILRSMIDKKREPARYILLGSSSPYLIKKSSQSLTGRIAYLELTPFNILEILDQFDLKKHWLLGGFPGSLLAPDKQKANAWFENLIKNYAERDFEMLGLDVLPQTIINFWRMLAHFHGGIWNADSFGRALGTSHVTVKKYLDFMEGTFLIRKLQPFHINIKKRLVKAPKVYIRDSGILHYLNDVDGIDQLFGKVLIGSSWEGYVVEQIAQSCPANIGLYYYRTHQGSEIDLVLTKGLQPAAGIEIKFTVAPSLSKGNTIALQDIGTKNNFIIYYGNEDYRQRKDLTVCSLEIFLRKYLPQIINN